MTLLDVQRISSHWRRSPPLRTLVRMVAGALGVKFEDPDQKKSKQYLNADEFARLVAATDGGRAWINSNG